MYEKPRSHERGLARSLPSSPASQVLVPILILTPFFFIDIEFVSTSYMSLTTTTTILVADTLALFTSRPLVCLFPPHPTTPPRLFDLSMLALCDPVDSIVLDIFNPIGIWLHDKLVWEGLCIIARTCHSSYRTKIPRRSGIGCVFNVQPLSVERRVY